MSGSTGNVIGSGSDSITLNMAEDQAQGTDASFTVSVDGQQIGPAQTVTASQSAGQTEAFTFKGDWAPGPHDVTVTFANNFLYPGSSGDRNLYVDGVTYDGRTVSNSTTPIYTSPVFPPTSTDGNYYGNASFSVNDTTPVPSGSGPTPTTSPSLVTVGSGPDTLVLNMAEDPYQGDAQFTVSVDGKQIGGTQTTTAVVSEGQFQEFDVKGDFGPGTHTVAVTYLNDAVGGYYPAGTPGLPAGAQWALDTEDRNLYVMGASLNGGKPASGLPWELSSNGTETFSVTTGSNPSATSYGSGLFSSDGAAASGNNAAITSDSVAGSSSGSMSFIAPSATTDTTSGGSGSTPSTGSMTDDSSSGTTTKDTPGSSSGSSDTTDTTPTLSSTMTGADTTPSAPTTTGSTTTTDQTSGTTGTVGPWWTDHQGNWATLTHQNG
jgi:Ca-dependent carbohydrate-binding module xylan-binding